MYIRDGCRKFKSLFYRTYFICLTRFLKILKQFFFVATRTTEMKTVLEEKSANAELFPSRVLIVSFGVWMSSGQR